MALRLHTIIASTRPGRVGPAVANWFHETVKGDERFDAHLVDLQDFELPVYDEPNHPRMKKYMHEHTRRWSESVEAADAYVFVVPEYNYGPTPALVNALNYVYSEWNYKPAGFVSYGGVSGGLRGVQMTKQIVTTLKMMPMVEQVTIPMVAQQLREGVFAANDLQRASVNEMAGELNKWGTALKGLRGK